MNFYKFGFSFFVIIATFANSANSIPIGVETKPNVTTWPNKVHLDESNWRNSCNLWYVHVEGNGARVKLNDSLEKVLLTAEMLPHGTYYHTRNTIHELDINTDVVHNRFMPKINKTLQILPFLNDIHKNVQYFVGMFDALSRDNSRFSSDEDLRHVIKTEMRYFLEKSKLLLCEIETAINATKLFRRPVKYLTREQMQHKVLKMASNFYTFSEPLLSSDAKCAKKYFYHYAIDLTDHLKVEMSRPDINEIPANKTTKKSIKSKANQNKRKLNKNKRKLAKDLNSSNISESSSVAPQKRQRKTSASLEKKQKRLNNKNKLNKNNKNNSNLSKQSKSQESGSKQQIKRHRHPKSSRSSAATSA